MSEPVVYKSFRDFYEAIKDKKLLTHEEMDLPEPPEIQTVWKTGTEKPEEE